MLRASRHVLPAHFIKMLRVTLSMTQKNASGAGCVSCPAPHGAIRQDGKNEKAKKCDLCIDRGRSPRCVEACPKKVLEFVEVDGDRRPIAENNVGAIHELPLLDSCQKHAGMTK